MKLKGSVKKGKQEPRDHHQTRHSPNSLALFATDSLELKLAYNTAIKEDTNTHNRDQARGRLGRNSRPRGRNFALNGTQGEVGVSLKKKIFLF